MAERQRVANNRPNGGGGGNRDVLSVIANGVDSALRYLRHIRRQPISVQVAIGSGTGIVTGYTFSKASKAAAISAGCTIIILQFFNYRGYLKFNQTQMQRDFAELKDIVREELGMQRSVIPSAKEVDEFLTTNGYLFAGFIAGSLIGYGLS